MRYPVTAIYKTFQGEGHFVGYRMVIVRLAGCSVTGCALRAECDEAPWKATETLTAAEIVDRAWRLNPGGIVLITGGEPTDHDLIPLVDGLTAHRLRVHLETSGVRALTGLPIEWITVSPKTPTYAQRTGHTLKIVVRPGWDWNQVLFLDEATTFFHRYLQPMTSPDGTNNLSEVISMLSSGSNPGGRWALSTQAHRTWGLR